MKWEGQSSLPASALRSGRWWWAALQSQAAKLEDSPMWLMLPATETSSSLVFKTFVRVMASIFDLLIARFRTYPLRLLDLLSSDEHERDLAITEFLSAPPCVLDDFSAYFKKTHPTAEALKDTANMFPLRVLMTQVHSRNLRRQRARTMTHNIELSELGLGLVARSMPPLLVPLHQHEMKKNKEIGDDNDVSSTKKMSKGGGGAWRAFVHSHGQLRPSQPRPVKVVDMRSLGQRYAELTEADKEVYRAAGRVATMRHADGLQAFPSTMLRSFSQRGLHGKSLYPSQTGPADGSGGVGGPHAIVQDM